MGNDSEPTIIMQGAFRLYETASGGYHLVYLADGLDEEKHIEIPAAMVKMAKHSQRLMPGMRSA